MTLLLIAHCFSKAAHLTYVNVMIYDSCQFKSFCLSVYLVLKLNCVLKAKTLIIYLLIALFCPCIWCIRNEIPPSITISYKVYILNSYTKQTFKVLIRLDCQLVICLYLCLVNPFVARLQRPLRRFKLTKQETRVMSLCWFCREYRFTSTTICDMKVSFSAHIL